MRNAANAVRHVLARLMVCGLIGMAGCRSAGWKLQFTDIFERPQPAGDWTIASGDWTIDKGALTGNGQIMCARKFTGAQRLEFDAVTKDPCDLSGILAADETGHRSGYFFGFGGEYNTISKLLIEGKEVVSSDALITPGKTHHVVCECEGGRLRHIVDGKVIATYTHESPLTGDGHQMIGFYIYTTGRVDNVKVYTKPEK